MKIDFAKKFQKQYQKLPPKIQNRFDERLRLFMDDPDHPLLRIHPLVGKYIGCKSINITGDVRAIYQRQDDGILLFVSIGTHSELYS